MEEKIICQGLVDTGATRVRGWHNYRPCRHHGKYKFTYKDGRVKYYCGVHKNEEKRKCDPGEIVSIEQVSK